MTSHAKSEPKRVGRKVIEITRPEKVLFPKSGIAKGELVEYYEQIAPIMLPYLKGRPIAMERGLHVLVPLDPSADVDGVCAFANRIAGLTHAGRSRTAHHRCTKK